MKYRSTISTCCLLTALLIPRIAESQVLGTLRSQVREQPSVPAQPAPPSPKKEDKQRSRRAKATLSLDDDSTDNIIGETIVYGSLFVVSSPFIVPRYLLEDEGTTALFPDYPYDGQLTAMTFDLNAPGIQDRTWIFQADTGTNFDGLLKTHGRLIADTNSRFGIDSEFYHWYERFNGGSDPLWTGDVNLVYRFAQSETWQFRAGLGMNWLADHLGAEAGINATYSAEWFPRDPWFYSGSIDWGRLGDSSLFHVRNTVGVTHNGWGVFTGHDYFHMSNLDTHAWINGLEFRY
ncbi:MAG: hypothetical protein KDA96_17940 [Planctomycetaceae bacterium]|nr:hypothetical protein [Planctomycetaceae bacterium]